MDGRLASPLPVRALALLAATVALALPTAARAAGPSGGDPAARWPAGGAAIQAAQAEGAAYWGITACGGDVGVLWDAMSTRLNAEAAWSRGYNDCEISLNRRVTWDWPKLCTVIVHELGHLTGHDHVDDPNNVMYPSYVQPLPACEQLAEPVQPLAGPAPAVAPVAAAPKTRAKAPSRKVTKRPGTSPKR